MTVRALRILLISMILMMVLAACGGAADNRPIPTLAQLPTGQPTTTSPTDEPTPTLESAGNNTGTQPTTAPVDTPIPVQMQPFSLNGAGIAADISGVETVRVTGAGTLACDESGAYVISTSADAIPRLSFTLPNDTPPGTYPLHDVVVDGIEVRPVMVLESGVTYDVQMDGLFVLNALPPAEGGAVKGDFEYAVASLVDPTKIILVRGGFDFNAPADFCK